MFQVNSVSAIFPKRKVLYNVKKFQITEINGNGYPSIGGFIRISLIPDHFPV